MKKGTSADGYIARTDGSVGWLNRPRPAGNYGMGTFLRSIDTIPMAKEDLRPGAADEQRQRRRIRPQGQELRLLALPTGLPDARRGVRQPADRRLRPASSRRVRQGYLDDGR